MERVSVSLFFLPRDHDVFDHRRGILSVPTTTEIDPVSYVTLCVLAYAPFPGG